MAMRDVRFVYHTVQVGGDVTIHISDYRGNGESEGPRERTYERVSSASLSRLLTVINWGESRGSKTAKVRPSSWGWSAMVPNEIKVPDWVIKARI